jgi:hypothetical protein
VDTAGKSKRQRKKEARRVALLAIKANPKNPATAGAL